MLEWLKAALNVRFILSSDMRLLKCSHIYVSGKVRWLTEYVSYVETIPYNAPFSVFLSFMKLSICFNLCITLMITHLVMLHYYSHLHSGDGSMNLRGTASKLLSL